MNERVTCLGLAQHLGLAVSAQDGLPPPGRHANEQVHERVAAQVGPETVDITWPRIAHRGSGYASQAPPPLFSILLRSRTHARTTRKILQRSLGSCDSPVAANVQGEVPPEA